MPSGPLADPALCSPICPATLTGSLLPTAGSSAFDGERVTFKWKDYRAKGEARYKLMTLDANEFIRRFLIHADGFHRIRHYGLFANANRAANIALARQLLGVPDPAPLSADNDRADGGHEDEERKICPCCGGRMVIIETFAPGCQSRLWPIPSIGLDSSRPSHPCRHSPSPLASDTAISPAPATLRRQRPSAPPSAGKTWSIEYQIIAPIASRAAKTSVPLVTQLSSRSTPTNQIKHRRQIPIDRHHCRRELPRGFLPRGFSDACLGASPRARVWQASENP